MSTQERELQEKHAQVPTPYGFSHISVPARDLALSQQFFVEVLGGDLIDDKPDGIRVRFDTFQIVLGPQSGGGTPRDAEYPHYTLLVKPEDLIPLKECLEGYGIPTHDIWTRNGTDAAMYFRSPTGNLWQFYCESGFTGPVRRGVSAGGDYAPDVKALNYDSWNDPGR